MSTMSIDSIYLGWTPEPFSIRIYWLCFLTSDSSIIWSHWNPNGSFHVQKAEVCYLLLLSHCFFLFSSKTRHYWPPVLSWSWWPLLSLLWHLGCSPLCLALLLSLLPSFWVVLFSPLSSSLDHPYFPLSFLRSHLTYYGYCQTMGIYS